MGFETFLGNLQALADVRGLLRFNRVPGALLFSGPDGVGKKTLALMLARALNCERRGPNGDDFCGECARCRKAEEMIASTREDLERRRATKDSSKRAEGLVYFDLQLIEPITRFILIEQIRQLRSVAYSHPFEFARRVFVIDQAQAVHWQAVDLLLKVLEEPPETTTLILIAPNAHELRSTIRSRCRKIQFLPVEESVIHKLLADLPGSSKSQQELGVRVADGSITVAKTFNLVDYQRRRKPWLDFLEAITARPSKSMGASDWKALFDSSKALTENRAEMDETLKTGYTLLRDLMYILLSGADAKIANVDLLPRLKTWAPKLGLGRIDKLKSGLDSAYRLQTRNVNQQLTMDALATEVLAQSR
jgi:DNA polymerase III subunit delta'